ncbi:hypothetical protein MPTK1_5g03130 [Marchantia polymorpha subsp. ruderalis]|uniref:Uncharacterized protein n=2 Tax=Marchantia polymorpha TaxID=3197 RepID=A0AAF6BEF0_MARPO|nr:hypothetical protein MARPO_0124s0010 [Marchantia polymorpha]BBN10384.1 hypothetical protein Mp_5g03130 [Marchantia polymorpha subsp. ruderalis]|eukprot:PTQ30433.1 hypothetical protein MARPO_0124s0010 [Marchantia polymorpha]
MVRPGALGCLRSTTGSSYPLSTMGPPGSQMLTSHAVVGTTESGLLGCRKTHMKERKCSLVHVHLGRVIRSPFRFALCELYDILSGVHFAIFHEQPLPRQWHIVRWEATTATAEKYGIKESKGRSIS